MTTATSHHHSNPFLLVRASDRDVTDVLDDEDEEGSSKSVPPRAPPSSVRPTSEQSLPSVIIDAAELEAAAPAEANPEEAMEVDGLLEAIEVHASTRDARRVQTLHVIDRPRAPRSALRGVGVLLVTATVIVGAAFAGLRVTHVSPRAVGAAALHILR